MSVSVLFSVALLAPVVVCGFNPIHIAQQSDPHDLALF